MTRRFVWVDRAPGRNLWGWVEVEKAPPPRRVHIANSSQEPLQSMADGRYYTCRRQMEREQRAQGFEVVSDSDRKYFDRPEHKPLDYSEAARRACDELGVD